MKHQVKKSKKKLPLLFIVSLAVFIILITLGETRLLGSELSKAAADEISRIFSRDLGGYALTVPKVLAAVAAVIFVYLLCFVLNFIMLRLTHSKHSRTVRELFASIIRGVGVILAIVWALSALGLNARGVFASLGIISLIVGFGAQSLIEDVICGIFIVFENQYNVGDIVVLGDFRGTVQRIGMRTTTITDNGGNKKIVNNSDIRNIQNRSDLPSYAVTDIGISYDEDLRRAEEIIGKALPEIYGRNTDLFLAQPKYSGVESIGESSVVLRFVVSTEESNVYAARRRLNRELRIIFAEKGLEIPFNQIVVHNGD